MQFALVKIWWAFNEHFWKPECAVYRLCCFCLGRWQIQYYIVTLHRLFHFSMLVVWMIRAFYFSSLFIEMCKARIANGNEKRERKCIAMHAHCNAHDMAFFWIHALGFNCMHNACIIYVWNRVTYLLIFFFEKRTIVDISL